MNLKGVHFQGMLALIAAAGVLATGSNAQPIILQIDGRDEANLASEGNHGTQNANVNFAFIYGEVVATNLSPNPPGPSSTSFHYTSTATPDGGGIGFGTNQLAFDASTAFGELTLTVNPGNTLPWLYLILKDVDPPTFAAEDLQYRIDIPATPGDYVLKRTLHDPTFVFNVKDGIANFNAGGQGLSEVQVQYPFGAFQAPNPHMDLTIHSIRIRMVPEPSSIALAALCGLMVGGLAIRRRSNA